MSGTNFVATVFDGKGNPEKVTVAFTMALNAVMKGHRSTVILMVEAVGLGGPGAASGMDIGKPFEPVQDLVEKYLEKGGRVAVCGACMVHHGMHAEHMDSRFEVINAPDVIDLLMGATGSLQIT